MSRPSTNSWRDVKAELARRINERVWRAGELIPGETELAGEFGCARATVNRAMRDLAEAGVIERRRRAGTRVAVNPVRKATVDISIIRLEVERKGQAYRHALLSRKTARPSPLIAAKMHLASSDKLLRLRTLHFADNHPFIYEDRWLNLEAAPEIAGVDFEEISANEWLVRHAPYTDGEIAFSAANAGKAEVDHLGARNGEALFIIERTTWNQQRPITFVRLAYAPGFRMRTAI